MLKLRATDPTFSLSVIGNVSGGCQACNIQVKPTAIRSSSAAVVKVRSGDSELSGKGQRKKKKWRLKRNNGQPLREPTSSPAKCRNSHKPTGYFKHFNKMTRRGKKKGNL